MMKKDRPKISFQSPINMQESMVRLSSTLISKQAYTKKKSEEPKTLQFNKKSNSDLHVLIDVNKSKQKSLGVNRETLLKELVKKRIKLNKVWHEQGDQAMKVNSMRIHEKKESLPVKTMSLDINRGLEKRGCRSDDRWKETDEAS